MDKVAGRPAWIKLQEDWHGLSCRKIGMDKVTGILEWIKLQEDWHG